MLRSFRRNKWGLAICLVTVVHGYAHTSPPGGVSKWHGMTTRIGSTTSSTHGCGFRIGISKGLIRNCLHVLFGLYSGQFVLGDGEDALERGRVPVSDGPTSCVVLDYL